MPAYKRIDRISEEIRKELCNIIRDLKDPGLSQMVSVTKVDVTKDLSQAKAYVSVFADEEKQNEAIKALKRAAGFIRKEVARRVNLRAVPEFSFILDDSIAYGSHIDELLKNL